MMKRGLYFPPKIRSKAGDVMNSIKIKRKEKKARISPLPLLFNILLEVLASAIRKEKKLKASRLESEKHCTTVFILK